MTTSTHKQSDLSLSFTDPVVGWMLEYARVNLPPPQRGHEEIPGQTTTWYTLEVIETTVAPLVQNNTLSRSLAVQDSHPCISHGRSAEIEADGRRGIRRELVPYRDLAQLRASIEWYRVHGHHPSCFRATNRETGAILLFAGA